MSTNKRNRSRRRHGAGARFRCNPSRGGPGVLLTCEAGNEIKCEREGRDMLRYYLDQDKAATTNASSVSVRLSLEQELALLQQQQHQFVQRDGPFQLFDTGCGGTVFLMYSDQQNKNETKQPKSPESDPAAQEEGVTPKRIRTDKLEKDTTLEKTIPKEQDIKKVNDEEQEQGNTATDIHRSTKIKDGIAWDPVVVVKSIARDIASPLVAYDIPASRFVTRMIPIQITCFASLKELEMVLAHLLVMKESNELTETANKKNKDDDDADNSSSNNTTPTFRIHIKKRQCNHISSQQFIETAAPLVMKTKGWKVQLNDPDFVIWIEVCKTLMGVSVLERSDINVAKNFNLAELRDKQAGNDTDSDGDDTDDAVP